MAPPPLARMSRRRFVRTRFAEVNAHIDGLGVIIQSVQRELATLRWMIGIGFTLLSIFLAISTFIRSSGRG